MAYYTKSSSFSDSVITNSANSLDAELVLIEAAFSSASTDIATAATANNHANLSAVTTAKHSGTSIILSDTGGKFTTDNAEAALQQLAVFTGLGTTGVVGQYLVGQNRDDSTVWPTGAPTCPVIVPKNAAPAGILVQLSAYIYLSVGTPPGYIDVPLKINTTSLSASGAGRHIRYTLSHGSEVGSHIHSSILILYLPADGWLENQINTVDIGTIHSIGFTAGVENCGLIVWALK
jgi:hypothetical protein